MVSSGEQWYTKDLNKYRNMNTTAQKIRNATSREFAVSSEIFFLVNTVVVIIIVIIITIDWGNTLGGSKKMGIGIIKTWSFTWVLLISAIFLSLILWM